ncbi:MAG: hypothetical protein NTX33_01580 [Propionibacteriales bacterium]|nr:hypothetical protein [Propionibacteriales bacterium]
MPERRTTWAAAAALPLLPLLLAGCGSEDVGAKPDLPSETPALWNPCDALDATFVKKHFGSDTTENAGTPTSPECRFAPAKDSGDAALTANYQLFGGTLDEFWDQMGVPATADVRKPAVPGADDARIVVDAAKDQLYVTGFLQNGNLFEVVNLVDPAPYDEKRAVRGVEATLTSLSAHADDFGAGEPSPNGS